MIATRAVGVAIAAALLSACASHSDASDPGPVPADGSDTSIQAAITAVTTFPTRLDPRLWNGMDLKPEVRAMSLKIVDRIVATSDIPGLTVDSVELTGSNASYEYDDSSDFGLHVFAHSAALAPKDLNGVLKLLSEEVERRQEGRITFSGIPVEVVFHGERTDSQRPAPGIGKYSVSEDRWIESPVQQPDRFDRTQMAADMTTFVNKYNALLSDYTRDKRSFVCSRFNDLDREMSQYRDSAFAAGAGSRSTQNLAFRALRRINVNIPQSVDDLEDDCTFTQESIG